MRTASASRRSPLRGERALLRGISLVLLTLAMLHALPAADTQAKQARAFTCATCHRDEAQFQPKTPMGIGLQLPPDQTTLIAYPKLTFEAQGYSYLIERHGDQSTYTVSAGGDSLTLPIRYAFGVHMQTFVLEREGHFYESLVSYYPPLNGLAVTMGDERIQPHNLLEAMGRETSNAEITRCFGCHTTNAVTGDQLHLDTMKPGLACEGAGRRKAVDDAQEARSHGGRGYLRILRTMPPHLELGSPDADLRYRERAVPAVSLSE